MHPPPVGVPGPRAPVMPDHRSTEPFELGQGAASHGRPSAAARAVLVTAVRRVTPMRGRAPLCHGAEATRCTHPSWGARPPPRPAAREHPIAEPHGAERKWAPAARHRSPPPRAAPGWPLAADRGVAQCAEPCRCVTVLRLTAGVRWKLRFVDMRSSLRTDPAVKCDESGGKTNRGMTMFLPAPHEPPSASGARPDARLVPIAGDRQNLRPRAAR
jgi:hypothetical protein